MAGIACNRFRSSHRDGRAKSVRLLFSAIRTTEYLTSCLVLAAACSAIGQAQRN
uniref:hypothetical protein n=1 Tax=Enterobacterales TaxID=91347 RepID=UPI0015EED2A6|nr:hypothetical protein [Enterobacter hormaechei]UUW41572.1 hypothetical protein [Leclercia sp. 29361]